MQGKYSDRLTWRALFMPGSVRGVVDEGDVRRLRKVWFRLGIFLLYLMISTWGIYEIGDMILRPVFERLSDRPQ